jgi:hypothetical protein
MQVIQKTQILMNLCFEKIFGGGFASIGGATSVWAVELTGATFSSEFKYFFTQ